MAIALITGGTSGIGAAFARALAGQGYDLVLVARDESRLAAAADELRAGGSHVETISADLADASGTDLVAARLADRERPVALLVNNAGFGLHSKISAPDVAEHDRAFAVMVRAVAVLSAAAVAGMRERGHGAIVNVGSVAGEISMGGYSALKAWVRSYSESLANELHGTGVTVTALLPGWVRTEFHERAAIRTGSIPGFLWLDADRLVRDCLRDVRRGRVISIPSVRFRVLTWFTRHLPRAAVRAVSRRISRSRSATLAE